MNWKEKDKKIRDILAKRLFVLRERVDELLRKIVQKCKLKQAKEVLSLIGAINDCLDEIRFTNYGYSDFEIMNLETIEEKQREMFERLKDIEKTLVIDEKSPDFIPSIRNTKIMVENLKTTHQEIKSLIMAFIPPKSEIIDENL